MEKSIEVKKLEFKDVNAVVRNIVDVLFSKSETTGDITYLGEYDEVLRVYFEMVAAFPDLKIHKIKIEEFFDRYCNGEFDEYVEILKSDRRIQYIENALDRTEQNLLKYYNGGQFAKSVTKFIDSLNDVVQKYSDSIEGIEKNDIKGFFNSFTEFASKTNTETVTAALLKKKKATPKPKKTAQTEDKKADE